MHGRIVIDVFLAIDAAKLAAPRRVLLDDIELVGGVLPFGRIACDAIRIVALQAGTDRLGVDRIIRLDEPAVELMQRLVPMQVQEQ